MGESHNSVGLVRIFSTILADHTYGDEEQLHKFILRHATVAAENGG